MTLHAIGRVAERLARCSGQPWEALARGVLCAGALGALILALGCQTAGNAPSSPAVQGPATESLRVGVTPTMAPLVFKRAGQLDGFEVEMARALGEELKRPIKFVELRWEELLGALTEGRIDIVMSGMSITPQRQVRAAFSASYLKSGQMTLIRREDETKFSLGIPRRPVGKIGVIEGTTGGFLVQQTFPGNPLIKYSSVEQGVSALRRKKVAMFVCDAPAIWWAAAQNEANDLMLVPVMMSDEDLGWAMRKTDTDLLNAVNAFLAKMQSQGRLAQIGSRWLPR